MNPVVDRPGLIRQLVDRGVEAVIAGGEAYDGPLFEAAPRLRVVARAGVGFDAVDLAAATKHRVVVAITPGANDQAVAEHTVAMLLAVGRGLVGCDAGVRDGSWPRNVLPPVRTRTLGIVGLGRIGRAVYTRAAALGMNLIACEPMPDRDFVARHAVRLVGFDDLLAQSDYVSLHVPLSRENTGLINRTTLAKMKPGAILINTARGGLVVEADLYDALKSGKLGGAALDVFEQEPTPLDNPLLTLPNVLTSPHMAGVDELSLSDMAEVDARAIVDLYQGRWPEQCVVNRQVGPGWKW
jgi:D-3-phosphoglycerate dehydrogenase/(S)-sulfolactate dehydrogenase